MYSARDLFKHGVIPYSSSPTGFRRAGSCTPPPLFSRCECHPRTATDIARPRPRPPGSPLGEPGGPPKGRGDHGCRPRKNPPLVRDGPSARGTTLIARRHQVTPPGHSSECVLTPPSLVTADDPVRVYFRRTGFGRRLRSDLREAIRRPLSLHRTRCPVRAPYSSPSQPVRI